MTEAQALERVRDILVDNFSVPAEKVTDEAAFRATLGMDSLDIVDLIFFLRQSFGVSDDVDDYRELHTVGKLCAFIVAQG